MHFKCLVKRWVVLKRKNKSFSIIQFFNHHNEHFSWFLFWQRSEETTESCVVWSSIYIQDLRLIGKAFLQRWTYNSVQFASKINTNGSKAPTTFIPFHTNYRAWLSVNFSVQWISSREWRYVWVSPLLDILID